MITSSSNQQMKNLSLLMKKAKERTKQGVFVVEGIKMCLEAPLLWVEAVYVSESFDRDEENHSRIEKHFYERLQQGMVLEVVADSVFKGVADTQTPQGIMAIVKIPEYTLESVLQDVAHKEQKPMFLLLESIQDPGNLGTMIRTGEGAGVTAVIMNKTTVDVFNPKTIRSTMGSIYRVPFVVAENLKEIVDLLQENDIDIYAAHLKGTMQYDEPNYTKGCAFMIGNEGNGLSDALAECADVYIKIPMEGQVESLNAAISATLLMYEGNRQRRNNGK